MSKMHVPQPAPEPYIDKAEKIVLNTEDQQVITNEANQPGTILHEGETASSVNRETAKEVLEGLKEETNPVEPIVGNDGLVVGGGD